MIATSTAGEIGGVPLKKSSTLKALTHLVNTTQHELDVNVNFLNQYKKNIRCVLHGL
ncbi:MAG: hypothetical protein LRY68_10830 [Sulfurospirillum sp.]|nr:hypothetical protein [Sulfurospirillum sp.]